MSTHTPGPWEYKPSESRGDEHHIGNSQYFPIFTVVCGTPEARANARLIAAAPDLLEACKRLAPIDFGGTVPWVHNAALTQDTEKLRAICLAMAEVWNAYTMPAIRKAEGGDR